MRLSDDLGFSALSWIKPELDQSLARAREALEAFADDSSDGSRIDTCLSELHQVQGSLRMVELYGAAMVVDEMESVARALKDQRIRQRDDAFAVLMGGMVQLPDYLERLQGGHKDIPIVLLPLLNDLRACRGEKLLSESVLFSPNLDAPLPEDAAGAAFAIPEARLKADASQERFHYQRALLHWIRSQGPEAALADMVAVLDRLRGRIVQEDARRLLWVAAGALDSVRAGGIEPSATVKLLFGRVDREIRKLIQFGEPGFRADPPRDLVKNLLYYIAGSTVATPRSQAIEQAYRLSGLLPTERELEHAKGSLVGKNRALLDTVSVAIKDDLIRVKDALDMHLRSGAGQADLGAQVEVLDRIGDTLGMLGLGEARKTVQVQREQLARMAMGDHAADERALMDVAGALISVESSLDDNIDRLGADVDDRRRVDVDVASTVDLPAVEVRRIIDTLMKEARSNLIRVREAVIAFIESPWDHRRVHEVPQLLNEVSGAMSMLAVEDAPELLGALRAFIEVELLRHKRVPDAAQLDLIADAFASIEYYIEAAGEHRQDRALILETTRRSLEGLGYWPPREYSSDWLDGGVPVEQNTLAVSVEPFAYAVPPIGTELAELAGAALETAPIAEWTSIDRGPVDGSGHGDVPPIGGSGPEGSGFVSERSSDPLMTLAATDSADSDGEWVEVEEEVEEDVQPAIPAAFQNAVSSEIDAEIREIFLDEVGEEIRQLSELVPAWGANRADQEALKSIRRSFHTLKGSGRLVGAVAIGEFSWKVENMLNRVLDGSVRPSDAAVALVSNAVQTLPELRAALAEGRASNANIADIMVVADELAQGREAWVGQREKVKVRRVRRVWVPRIVAAAAGPAVPGVLAELAPIDGSVDADLQELQPTDSAAAIESDDGLGLLLPQEPVPVAEAVAQAATVEEATAEEATAEEARAEEARAEEATVEQATVDEATAEEATVEQATVDEATADEATAEQATADEATAEQATAEQATAEQATADEATADEATADEATAEEATAEEATAEEATAEEATAEEATAEEATAEEATAEEATVEEAIAEEADFHGYNASDEQDDRARIPALDPLLLEILRAEVGGHIETLRAYVADAESGHARPVDDALVHAIHTMHGALSMSDVPGIAEVAGPLEGYAKRLRARLAAPDWAGVAAMREVTGLCEQFLSLLDRPGAPIPEIRGLPGRISALRDALPELPRAFSESDETAGGYTSLDESLDLDGLLTEADADAIESVAFDADLGVHAEIEAALNAISDMLAPEDESAAAGSDFRLDSESPQEQVQQEPVEAFSTDSGVPDGEAYVAGSGDDESTELPVANNAPIDDVWVVAVSQDLPQPRQQPAAGLPLPWVEEAEEDEALELSEVALELVDLFVEEANEQIDVADRAVARLRDDAQDRSATADLQRELHTLKGNARAIGLAPIGDLTHAIEALVEATVAGSVMIDERVVDSLERGFDRLRTMVERVSRRQAVAHPASAIAFFERHAISGSALVEPDSVGSPELADAVTPPSSEAEVELVAVEATPVEAAPRQPLATSLRDLDAVTAEPAADEPTTRAPQELIRVRSDLLDSLVNVAGEVAIYRSRLEQQIGSYRANLVELDQTVTRLRGQLRQLEMETEAQILSRYQREAEAGGEVVFDPLELDRFSTLQQLSRALSESVNDLVALQTNLDDLTRQSETLLLQQSRVSTELQEGLMRSRMVPFDSVVPFLRRVLRQTGDELGRRAQLRIEGVHGEMDRNLLERMKAPLEHMIRNALAHGIEAPADRIALGKPPEGEVRIAVGREATEVVIRVSDDGAGINREAIRAKAVQRGLLRGDALLSDRDLFAFVLESGFSTAEQVTQISGRGVGMDVVAGEIKQLGGSLGIDSVLGQGTSFTVRLPFTLAVTQAVLIRVGEHHFAVPMSAVQGIARIARGEYSKRMEGGQAVFNYAGDEYSLHDLAHLLTLTVARREQELQLPLLLVRAGDQRAAVRIDSVLGSREVVVKPVGPQINSVPGIFGATIMGDGSVVMILDLAPLLRRALSLREQGAVERALEAALADAVPGLVGTDESIEELVPFESAPMPEPRRRPLVAVVDDSITMRRVTSRVLERNDLEVVTAKDGLDAVERFQERIPDLILLDIEMPRMDGYELATYVRNDVRLRHIPIIMITSRTGDKHRQRAQEIGVERYLGKPYQEAELLKNVAEMLSLTHELR
jgi:chemosensory pili system protein ChpA (sensor histidine kinase/response regulator)